MARSSSQRAFEEWEQGQPPYSNESNRYEAFMAGWFAREKITKASTEPQRRGRRPSPSDWVKK